MAGREGKGLTWEGLVGNWNRDMVGAGRAKVEAGIVGRVGVVEVGVCREEDRNDGKRRSMVRTLLLRFRGCWAGGVGAGKVRGCGGSGGGVGGEGGAAAGGEGGRMAYGSRPSSRTSSIISG
jgi:hypothetical protein